MAKTSTAIILVVLLIAVPIGCTVPDDAPVDSPSADRSLTPAEAPNPAPLPAPREDHPDPLLVITAPVPGSVIDGPVSLTGYVWGTAGPVRYRIACRDGPELAGGTIPVALDHSWVPFSVTLTTPLPIACDELLLTTSHSDRPPRSMPLYLQGTDLMTVPVFFPGPDRPIAELRVVPSMSDPGLVADRLLAELEFGPYCPYLKPVIIDRPDYRLEPEHNRVIVSVTHPLPDSAIACLALTLTAIPGVNTIVIDGEDRIELSWQEAVNTPLPVCSLPDQHVLALRQLLADHGHDTWRLDPVSKLNFAGAGPGLSNRTSFTLVQSGTDTLVRIVHRGMTADFTMVQPVHTGTRGIWVISEISDWEPFSPEHPDIPILMYHEIGDPIGPYRELFVSPDQFARQMQYLVDHGYHTVTMADVAGHWLYGLPLPDRPIVITFDDGYRGQYEHAFPIMAQLDQFGTLYLVENLLGRPGYLTVDMAQEMFEAGFEAGGHTRSHPDLTTVDPHHLYDEVTASRHRLQQTLATPVATFCYPAGRYGEREVVEVREAGYETAVTVRPGMASYEQPLTLARIRINRSDTLNRFADKLQGKR